MDGVGIEAWIEGKEAGQVDEGQAGRQAAQGIREQSDAMSRVTAVGGSFLGTVGSMAAGFLARGSNSSESGTASPRERSIWSIECITPITCAKRLCSAPGKM